MRMDLDRNFEEVKAANGKVESEQIASKNRIKEMKLRLLREIYAIMQDAGVDPNDVNSIGKFLQTMEEQEPDLVELFEKAFSALVPDEAPAPAEGPGLMDKYSNLQETMLREPAPSNEGQPYESEVQELPPQL